MGKLYFTCSFDDGDVADLRLAFLLNKYGFKGTFYVPQFCDLVSESLVDSQIRELAQMAEVGGHTIHHTILTNTTVEHAKREIDNCKKWLEDVTGYPIRAFCPPTGRFNNYHITFQREAGFTSMRTVEMLSYSIHKIRRIDDFIILPATTQVYNHVNTTYIRNIIKRFNFFSYPPFRKMFNSNWMRMSMNYVSYLHERAGTDNRDYYFHLWGHSWELEEFSLWESFEEFIKQLSDIKDIISCTNSELADYVRGAKNYER